MVGLWILETVLWVCAYVLVVRSIGKIVEPLHYLAPLLLVFTTMGIEAMLLRPVWFAIATLMVSRTRAIPVGPGLAASYLVSLFVTVVISWFWHGDKGLVFQRPGLPSSVWFMLGAGVGVSLVWLWITRESSNSGTSSTAKSVTT